MSMSSSPHDHYSKEVLGDLEVAEDFLRNYLPVDLAKLLDFGRLFFDKG